MDLPVCWLLLCVVELLWFVVWYIGGVGVLVCWAVVIACFRCFGLISVYGVVVTSCVFWCVVLVWFCLICCVMWFGLVICC